MVEMQEKSELSQERVAEFQQYIFNVSSKFIAIEAEHIPEEISLQLREVARYCDFAQIFYACLTGGGNWLQTRYSYSEPNGPAIPADSDTSQIPWLVDILRSGQPKIMPNVIDDLPTAAETDRKVVAWLGISSALILPVNVGGVVRGGLFFNNMQRNRHYPSDLIRELRHFSQIMAGALERYALHKQTLQDMQFDRLLSEVSATYINLSSDQIISSMHKDLGRLGMFMEVDRCLFYMGDKKPGIYHIDDSFNWWCERDAKDIDKLQRWLKEHPDFIDSYRYCFERWDRGEVVQFSSLDDLPAEAEKMRWVHERFGNISWLSVPVSMGGEIVGAMVVATTHERREWSPRLIPRLRLFGEIFANALRRKEQDDSLKSALHEIRRLNEQVEADYVYLRDELTLEHNYEDIIGQSEAIKAVLYKVEQVAPTDVSVLITGETGTGKELIARAIHHISMRSARPLIKVNCAALAPNLIESELFGHERGAFTGAEKRRIGRFELANGATLFLDEVGELPLELQPKLLRVLQEKEFERLGGSQTIRVDVRIIAATNRNLQQRVEEGRFRSDLWYRLNSFPVYLPPLRERQEDIPLFVRHFVNMYCHKVGKSFDKIPKRIIEQLRKYSWPGNIREMENIISRSVIISEEGHLQVQLPDETPMSSLGRKSFHEMEKELLLQVLDAVDWKIEGQQGAACRLDLKPSTLRNKMKKLGIIRK